MKTKKTVLIVILAYLNLVALEYTNSLSGDQGVYIGTGIFSFMPESIMTFAVCIILLKRFFSEQIFSDRRRVSVSIIFGLLVGFCCVWSQHILYSITLFDSSSKVVAALLAGIGISFFSIPLTSEVIGIIEKISGMNSSVSQPDHHTFKQRSVYCIGIWLLFMLSYLPIFLYVWPMNFFGDSWDELLSQINGVRTTHHTVIHGLMLRKFYLLGLKLGAPEYGIQFMTILQMGLMAAAFACFMLYLYDRSVNKKIRIAFLLICILNPVNGYYAVTAEKGTMGIALAMIGMIGLMRMFDLEEEGVSIKNRSFITHAIMFVLFSSSGCLFRNNMIYAFLLGGIIVAALRKNISRKLVMLLIVIACFGAYKIENSILIKAEGSVVADQYRETFPYPIMCLTRVARLHQDELEPEVYESILRFIPQEAMDRYIISFSDDVKAGANEGLLRSDTGEFIKLFIKCGLKYPGDYLDQMAWLTYGYWNPYHAFTLGSTTPIIVKPLPEEYTDVLNRNLVPALENIFLFVYYHEGRFQLPLFAWCYRGCIYFWSVILLLIYGIARKNGRMISVSAVPIFYLMTIFAGPLCQFRYMYFNVMTLPIILYSILITDKSKDRQ